MSAYGQMQRYGSLGSVLIVVVFGACKAEEPDLEAIRRDGFSCTFELPEAPSRGGKGTISIAPDQGKNALIARVRYPDSTEQTLQCDVDPDEREVLINCSGFEITRNGNRLEGALVSKTDGALIRIPCLP